MNVGIDEFISHVPLPHKAYFLEKLQNEAIVDGLETLTEEEVKGIIGIKLGYIKSWKKAIAVSQNIGKNEETNNKRMFDHHPFELFEKGYPFLENVFSTELALELKLKNLINCVDEFLDAIAVWAAYMLIECDCVEESFGKEDEPSADIVEEQVVEIVDDNLKRKLTKKRKIIIKKNCNYGKLVMVLNCKYQWLFKHDDIMVCRLSNYQKFKDDFFF